MDLEALKLGLTQIAKAKIEEGRGYLMIVNSLDSEGEIPSIAELLSNVIPDQEKKPTEEKVPIVYKPKKGTVAHKICKVLRKHPGITSNELETLYNGEYYPPKPGDEPLAKGAISSTLSFIFKKGMITREKIGETTYGAKYRLAKTTHRKHKNHTRPNYGITESIEHLLIANGGNYLTCSGILSQLKGKYPKAEETTVDQSLRRLVKKEGLHLKIRQGVRGSEYSFQGRD